MAIKAKADHTKMTPRRRGLARAWGVGWDDGIAHALERVLDSLSDSPALGDDRYTIEGHKAAIAALQKDPQLSGLYEHLKIAESFVRRRRDLERQREGTAALLRARQDTKDPAVKAARTKQYKRALREEGQAVEFAHLIRGGHTTQTARRVMKIGGDKAKRLRALAVRMKLLDAQQRTRHPKPPK
jgi:hypothetical protein